MSTRQWLLVAVLAGTGHRLMDNLMVKSYDLHDIIPSYESDRIEQIALVTLFHRNCNVLTVVA